MSAAHRSQAKKQKIHATAGLPQLSLNQSIRDDIVSRITSGEWPPGHRLPFEHEMMTQYGCSRMTVSKVLSSLSDQGLITRRRRAGSIVAAPSAERAVLQITDFAAEAKRLGRSYAFKILERRIERIDAVNAKRLGLKTGSAVLVITTIHSLEGSPEAYEKRIINLTAVPGARAEAFTDAPAGTWLLRQVPWSDAEHVIRAVNADAKLAGLLGIAPSAACLVLERRTWQNGVLLTEAKLFYAGSGHSLVGRFSPTGNDGFSAALSNRI